MQKRLVSTHSWAEVGGGGILGYSKLTKVPNPGQIYIGGGVGGILASQEFLAK